MKKRIEYTVYGENETVISKGVCLAAEDSTQDILDDCGMDWDDVWSISTTELDACNEHINYKYLPTIELYEIISSSAQGDTVLAGEDAIYFDLPNDTDGEASISVITNLLNDAAKRIKS